MHTSSRTSVFNAMTAFSAEYLHELATGPFWEVNNDATKIPFHSFWFLHILLPLFWKGIDSSAETAGTMMRFCQEW